MRHSVTKFFLRFIITILISIAFFKTADNVSAQTLTSFSFSEYYPGTNKIAGLPFNVTITALDESSQVLTTFNNTATLSDTTGTIYPEAASFTDGIWSVSVYITQSTTSTALTVAYSTVSDMSSSFAVDPDSRIKFLSIVQGSNQTGTVGQQLPISLLLRVADPYNNPLSNIGVVFAISSAPPGATNQSLTNYSATSNSSGEAATSFTLGRTKGNYVVTSSIATGNTNTVHFYETANPSNVITIGILPAVAIIPGGAYLPFNATGYDLYANDIQLPAVDWSVQNGGGSIDGTGVFYAGTTLGVFTNTVKATYGSIGATATVNVVGTAGAGTASGSAPLATPVPIPTPTPQPIQVGVLNEIVIDPSVISALRNATIPIYAQGVDAFGQALTDVTYTFEAVGDLGTIVQTGASSALLTVSQAGLGAVQVTATQGQITTTRIVVGSVGNGINRRLIIENITSPQRVGEPFTISIAAKDIANNFITDYEGPIVLADTTGTIDPATVQPSDSGIWYVQAVITLAHPEVTVTAAGDGMVGVSNIFEVIGQPNKDDVGPGLGLGGFSEVLGASISAILDQLFLDRDLNKFTIFRYIGSGLAAGFGILGASIGGGIMVSRGLEAIGRNPFAKNRLKANLYASLIAFILAASLAVFASFLILR